MALSKEYSVNIYGKEIKFENSYIEIVGIEGAKSNIRIFVTVYDSNEKTNIIKNGTYEYTPSFDSNSENNFKQGYEYLKTLEEFEGAIDILEDV